MLLDATVNEATDCNQCGPLRIRTPNIFLDSKTKLKNCPVRTEMSSMSVNLSPNSNPWRCSTPDFQSDQCHTSGNPLYYLCTGNTIRTSSSAPRDPGISCILAWKVYSPEACYLCLSGLAMGKTRSHSDLIPKSGSAKWLDLRQGHKHFEWQLGGGYGTRHHFVIDC